MIVNIGSNIIQDCQAVLIVNDVEVFRLRDRESDGRLICDFDVRDEQGNRLAKIAMNNVVFAAPNYEIRHLPRESSLVDQDGNIIVRVIETSLDEIFITGDFWIKGHHVLITDNELISSGVTMKGNRIMGFNKAISLKPNAFSIGLH